MTRPSAERPRDTVHSSEEVWSNCARHIWLALTTQKSLYNFHMLVYESSKREMTQTPGMLYFAHKVLRLDFLRASNQRFLAKPRVTLGDPIELFAVVTSPLKLEELDFLLETVN